MATPAMIEQLDMCYLSITPVLRFVAPHPTEQLQRCIEEVLPAFRSQSI